MTGTLGLRNKNLVNELPTQNRDFIKPMTQYKDIKMFIMNYI
jgi:hypothetical protein